ncbi:MAG: DNA polymerase III subunit delta [Planctomycetes bacterium RBG_16_64_10]|nr:MAG: DNA polymerase III subunit delta [Planctomycetes bacterium RBG_16_64_10]
MVDAVRTAMGTTMRQRTVHALDFLQAAATGPVPPVGVVFGDERFLKCEVLAQLRRRIRGDRAADFSIDVFAGNDAEFRAVFDALSTGSLFDRGQRLVLVEEADSFVSRCRRALEDYATRPAACGVLVLDVSTWSKGSRLYRQLAETGFQIECTTPTPARLGSWLTARAAAKYHVKLARAEADLIVQMVEPSLGLLDQELARLALAVGSDRRITGQLIRDQVGSWRVRSTWDLVDSVADGNAAEAFRQLDRLLGAGEQPIVVLAQLAATLRRFAAATELIERAQERPPRLSRALQQAGVPPFALRKAEQQLRQLGRARARRLHRWLLAADSDMKGHSSSPARQRFVLEQLIVRLSSAAQPRGAVTQPSVRPA